MSDAPTRPGLGGSGPGLIPIGVQPSLRRYIVDLWGRREFIITMALGTLRSQNQNTVLGNLWHLLNPLLLAGVYYLVFGVFFNARQEIENFTAYLIIGILVYTFTSKAMVSGARAIVTNLSMMQSIRFPRAALPMASTGAESAAQLPTVVAMALIVILTGARPSLAWLWVLPAAALQAAFNLGLSFLTARATFHFRDVENFLPYILRIWMYLSGLFYTAEFVDRHGGVLVGQLFRLNPLWAFMTINRDALLGGTFDTRYWGLSALWAFVVLVGGFAFFWWNETEYSRG